jgi:hypothetical protein
VAVIRRERGDHHDLGAEEHLPHARPYVVTDVVTEVVTYVVTYVRGPPDTCQPMSKLANTSPSAEVGSARLNLP